MANVTQQLTVDMTFNDFLAKVMVIQFGTNRLRIYDFLRQALAVDRNFALEHTV